MPPAKRSARTTTAAWLADLEEGAAPTHVSAPSPRRPPPFAAMPATASPDRARSARASPAKRPRDAAPAHAAVAPGIAAASRRRPSTARRSVPLARGSSSSRPAENPRGGPAASAAASASDPATRPSAATAASALWDRVGRATDACVSALDEAAAATATDTADPAHAAGVAGFGGRTSNSAYGAGHARALSATTRKKHQTRAAARIAEARAALAGLVASFDETRNYTNALHASLARSESAQTGVTEQLRSTAGYAEETTARLRQTAEQHRRAEMTAKQLGEALDAANAHIADLTRDLNSARRDEAAVRAAERANATAADLERRCAKAESSNERHKEAVAKLTADNMVFLMRLKESEEESRAARAEADSMRGELDESRGAWFDKARKDVERVVERAMKRAEQSDAALEAELVAGEQRAEEWGAELAKMRAVLAQNATLARATEEATNALDDAVAARRDAERRAFDAANAQKAATAAMASAREDMGVLKLEMAELSRELAEARKANVAMAEKAATSVKALATQQAINASVMRSKNDMEWRVYEMQVAFEKARGGEAPKMPNLEVQTPRTAGRPGPADGGDEGVAGAALSPMPPGFNIPTPELRGFDEEPPTERSAEAGAPFEDALEKTKNAAGFEALPEPSGASFSSPEKKKQTTAAAASSPAASSPGRPRGARRVAQPLIQKSSSLARGGAYGTANARSPAKDAARLSEPARLSSPGKHFYSPERGGGSRERERERERAGQAQNPAQTRPAWSASPSKRDPDARGGSLAVADARRASAEWSRAQAREYREGVSDATRRPRPSPPRAAAEGKGASFRSSMAAAAEKAAEGFDAGAGFDPDRGAGFDLDPDPDLDPDLGLLDPVPDPSRPQTFEISSGWIGGRPDASGVHPSVGGRSATASDDDEDGGEAARAYPVAFDDDEEEDDDDSDLDGAAAAALLAPLAFLAKDDLADEHEAAMTRLLSSEGHGGPRAVPSYGADGSEPRRSGKRRVTFGNALPPSHAPKGVEGEVRRTAADESEASAEASKKKSGGGFTFAQALPRVR